MTNSFCPRIENSFGVRGQKVWHHSMHLRAYEIFSQEFVIRTNEEHYVLGKFGTPKYIQGARYVDRIKFVGIRKRGSKL